MKTFKLDPSDKELLGVVLLKVESILTNVKEAFDLEDFPPEKVLTFLYEVDQLSKLDGILREDFQPNQNPYEELLDAIGEKYVLQQKELGGTTNNSSKVNMRPGKTVNEYVCQIMQTASKKKALFAVRNRKQGLLCVVPVKSFKGDYRTYISWNNFTNAKGAKTYRVT